MHYGKNSNEIDQIFNILYNMSEYTDILLSQNYWYLVKIYLFKFGWFDQ